MSATPAWLPEIPDFAGVSSGRRVLTWNIPGPGPLARNTYEMAWVEVTEERPFKGEPLRICFTRRMAGSYERSSFTEAAHRTLKAEIAPWISRSFDAIWKAHSAPKGIEAARGRSKHMKAYAAWWARHADLMEAYALDGIELRPTPPTPIGQHPFRVRVLNTYRLDGDYDTVIAEALIGGERVGWLTSSGLLAPIEEPPL